MEPVDRPAIGPSSEASVLERLLRSFAAPDSYGLVLLLIVATYVLSASLDERIGSSIVLLVQIASVWFALRTSRSRRGVRIGADIVLVGAAALAVASAIAGSSEASPAVFVASCLLYLIAPVAIVRHLAYRRQIDLETMLGAVSAYLLIGMAFAFIYRFLGGVQSSPFFGAQGQGRISQDLFFSMTTMTTTGYGNLVPTSNPGQSIAVLEMILGQLFLITAVGKIVSQWRPGSSRASLGRSPDSG
jgi:hypothetical protein